MQSYTDWQYMPYITPYITMDNQNLMSWEIPAMPVVTPFDMQQSPMDAKELEPYTYPKNLPEALRLIEQAVEGETEDRLFYKYLIDNAPSEQDKEIIRGIREDEGRHFNLFRQVYFQLTGQTLPPPQNVTFVPPKTYCEGIKNALMGEQNAVQKYRRILFALQNRVQINILTQIITDELRHGILYNYLYAKNDCKA